MRAALAPLAGSFADRFWIISPGIAVELCRRRGKANLSVRSLDERHRQSSSCRKIEPRGAPVCGVGGPQAMASSGFFGELGCSFVGWHLTTAWSEHG